MKRLLIAGCGDLGNRLAARLQGEDWQVHGLRRNPENLAAGIAPIAADLSDSDSLRSLPRRWDAVIYQATPDERNEAGYRTAYADGLARLFDHIETRRLIFVSSTAVYAQNDGRWVDETSPTRPERFNGRILLEAEARAFKCAAEPVVVRFSGIYGPGRDALIRALREGRARCREHPVQWTNRIHSDDCAGVLSHLLVLPAPERIYCASDGHPAARCEVLDWLADRLHLTAPQRVTEDDARQGKRVSSRRLIASGYRFTYPDFRAGYEAMLQ